MSTNVVPDDLAYVTAGAETPGLAGRFVRVERAFAHDEIFPAVDGRFIRPDPGLDWSGCWVCSASDPLPWINSSGTLAFCHERPICDSILRPIRDNDGEDETLTWAPVPGKKETV